MTDARHPASGVGAACPDFESLSCYADGEVDAEAAAVLADHVDGCDHCATLAARLREGVGEEARRDGGIGGSGCVGEEHLIVYATGGLAGSERAALLTHLDACDPCVGALATLHRRLGLAATIATPIPAGVQQRAKLALETGMLSLVPPPERRTQPEPRGIPLLERLRGLLRVPVLVPAAMAAGALLTVALQPGLLTHDSGERSRAIAPQTVTLRINVGETIVRSRPSMQSAPVATVRRGTTVEVAGEERDWYQVRLADGQAGWVEREAFE